MNRTKWLSCAMLFLMMALGMSYAQMAAGSNRPVSVPPDYVITPFGYFHPACVREIKQGQTVLGDGRIRFKDGSEETVAPSCAFPRYMPNGEIAVAGGPLFISWTWIEAGQVSTTSSYGKIKATWTVPLTPKSNDGQTLFFFPGFMDIDDTELIIQPVLGWNDGQVGVGPWNIASWNCCPGGTANYSTPVTVNSGDKILGTIKSACKAGVQDCGKWNITTKDVTTNKSTTLSNTPSEGQIFNWAQSGVLEVYSIAKCSDFPPYHYIKFTEVALYDYNFKKIVDPGWTAMYWVTKGVTDPWCGYKAKTAPKKVTLLY